jgi:pimeloyl-ACP methyl ester carboxylesterase
VVFLHDGLLGSVTWDRQVPAFAPFFRAIRYDRRGYGLSESQAKEHSDVADLLALLDGLNAADAVLVGCSSGGELALDFALAHPGRVRALVLVGPVVSGFDYTEQFWERGFRNYRPMFERQDVAASVERWVQDPWLTDGRSGDARAFLRQALTRHPDAAVWRTPPSKPPDRPALPRLGGIRVPTLIVVGASDIPDVHVHAGAIAAGIPGAERTVVEGAGHLVHLERPEEFNARVLSFLRPAEEAAAWVAAVRREEAVDTGVSLFAYDSGMPLDLQEQGVEARGETRVHDVSYASPKGGRVPAYLVTPAGRGRHAAIVFVHHGQGDRKTFLDEAIALAGRGAVSLLIDAPEVRPGANPPGRRPWDPVIGRAERVQGIIDVRRGFDLLAGRDDVDPRRLAYVGYSLGATLGATLAGEEARPMGYVLMAGYPSLTRAQTHGHGRGGVAFRTLLSDEDQRRWVEAMAPLDGIRHVGRNAHARFLLQFATRDEFISRWDAEALARATTGPTSVEWYESNHFGLGEASREARGRWLTDLLGLPER